MKVYLYVFILLLTVSSCQKNTSTAAQGISKPPVESHPPSQFSEVTEQELPIDTIAQNTPQLKNGYFLENTGMERDGFYVDGKKEGIWRVYYDREIGKVLSVQHYKNDVILWAACPAADLKRLIPRKGMHVKNDSTLIVAPHINGKTWYEGYFNSHQAYGIHKIYHFNGILRGVVDYKVDTVIEFDTLRNVIFRGCISEYHNFSR